MDAESTTSSPEKAIMMYWRLPQANGHALVCVSYRTDAGLELRAGLDGEPAVLLADVETHAEAQRLADAWREEITRSAAA
jgi:hypothetical protein